jgi:hypothetical protein
MRLKSEKLHYGMQPISVWPHLGMQFFFFYTSYLQQKILNKIKPDLNSGFPFFFHSVSNVKFDVTISIVV